MQAFYGAFAYPEGFLFLYKKNGKRFKVLPKLSKSHRFKILNRGAQHKCSVFADVVYNLLKVSRISIDVEISFIYSFTCVKICASEFVKVIKLAMMCS